MFSIRTLIYNSTTSMIDNTKLIILGVYGYYVLDLERGGEVKGDYEERLQTAWSEYTPVRVGEEVMLVWTGCGRVTFVNLADFKARFVEIPGQVG